MIISHILRFVYIGPPKTASTSIHDWLKHPLLFDEERDVDTRSEGRGEQHRSKVPNECRDYFVFASIREEESRLRSLWRMSRSEAERGEDISLMSYWSFLEWRGECDKPFYERGLESYLTERIDAFVRFENLEEDVRRLPFVSPLIRRLGEIPWVNRNLKNPVSKEEELLEEFR